MTIGVKICGLTEENGLHAAIDSGADWIGFVFFPRSPRFVSIRRATELVQKIPAGGPARVGLFVKASDDDIASVLTDVELDVLQIYDTPQRAEAIRRRFGLPVWQACGITRSEDLPQATVLDGFVIEARAGSQATRPGGNGQTFDWRLTRDWPAPATWLLAGGLTPANVGTAIAQSGAQAVDVSSGVEASLGVKDPALIRKFIQAARGSCLPAGN
ncbi:phosphoribosyl anthranilate isomerase [Neoasaia chiangmaiensis NBRC 101099]|uniref:N-(5'-phosphoribosyl)anthranilate isomerase n=1 Tax=Neoasaia chiangmaiensis TaxID=320497 RepID=A0A1U9KPF3_9PROT|nr:phosphoribosylanthranilate isomerase [Neoasaia chiangmaiensis]AQS87677.1 N-(5'-phosphoribosyl)anthranilate isomerase [Neoasaia chiangmaiensis]GBR41879.1 phosphoribosyl anthranilate isomerase [Neoasaia chiangmaiensis NBRC 101099]GEN14261.1 N-(5'-phosphoribosyl)anthranilate isomerase [Neoasaia chiangmaiensis]